MGFFKSPKVPKREPDPELERLKAEETQRVKKLKADTALKKKRFQTGMMGPRSLMTGGYRGYRGQLGYEEQDFA